MFARELGQLLPGSGMTFNAVLCQARPHDHLFRRVCIGVAGGAISHHFAVGEIMASGAFGHQRFVVPLIGVVGVDGRMALLAIKLVSGAIIAQVSVVA